MNSCNQREQSASPQGGNPRRGAGARLAGMLIIFLMTLILAEMALRVFGIGDTYMESTGRPYLNYYGMEIDSLYWTRQPGYYDGSTIDFKYVGYANSLGHRELEPDSIFKPVPIQYDTISFNNWSYDLNRNAVDSPVFFILDTGYIPPSRTIVMGDSFIEGVGADYDSSFVRQLETLLNHQSQRVQCYNAGCSGSDPFFDYVLLRDKLVKYQPQIVIETFNLSSDYWDFIMRGGFERFADGSTQFKPSPWFEPYFKHSYVIRLLMHWWGYNELLIRNDDFQSYCNDMNWEFISIADSMAALAQKNNFKLLFAIIPGSHDLVYDPGYAKLNRQLMLMLRWSGYNVVSAWEPMNRAINADNRLHYAYPHDGHYNAAGYKLLAESITEEVKINYPQFWERW